MVNCLKIPIILHTEQKSLILRIVVAQKYTDEFEHYYQKLVSLIQILEKVQALNGKSSATSTIICVFDVFVVIFAIRQV